MSVEDTAPLTPTLTSHEAWLPSEHPLHRPRHGDHQFTALLCAAVFFVVPVLVLAMGARPAEFENRRLTPFPSLRSGWGFAAGLNGWAADHLPFRDAAVHAADSVSRGVFGEPPPFDRPAPEVRTPFVPPAPLKPDISDSEDVEQPNAAGFPKVIEGRDGWLYYGFDMQGKCKPVRELPVVVDSLKRLRAAVEASGRRFVLVVAPDKSTAVPEYLPDGYAGKSCARQASERFWRRATTELGALDLRDDLRRIAAEGGIPPYHRLDTHWDDRAALAMVRRVAEHLEPGVTSTWRIEPERTTHYEPDLPTLLGRPGGVNVVQLYSLAPDGNRDRTRAADTDLRTPASMNSLPGPGMVDSRVAILCDSYTLAATRYLAATFADADAVFHSVLYSDPNTALDLLVDQDVIMVEVVERNIASGFAAITDPAVVDLIGAKLAANPR